MITSAGPYAVDEGNPSEAEVWMLQYRINAQPQKDAAHADNENRNTTAVIRPAAAAARTAPSNQSRRPAQRSLD